MTSQPPSPWKTFTDKKWALKNIKWFNPPPTTLPQGPRRPYLCSFSCLWSESMLYVLKWQKEHKRAFFVCTLRMCASIARFVLGAMSQFPHLYMYSRGPNFIMIGVSINPDPDAPSSASCLISSSSMGSSFTGVEGPGPGEAGVGVVALFSCLKSWGNSPGPTSSHVRSNNFQPSATILCPAATVRTAENACIDSVDMNTIELITFHTNLYRQCRHTTKHI